MSESEQEYFEGDSKTIAPAAQYAPPAQTRSLPSTPMEMLGMAVQNGMAVAALEKLMDLQERWEANEARKAYSIAISQFQAKVPAIIKRKAMKTGNAVSYYAPLGDIVEQIKDTLAECQLSFRFKIEDIDGGIKVTCTVAHALGHSEQTSMSGGADDSGSKNKIQALGSSVTYLQRYTLVGALGLTTADEDMDGRVHQTTITAEQRDDLMARMKAADVNAEKFFAYMKVSEMGEITSADWAKADQAIRDQEKRKAEKKAPAKKAPAKETTDADQ